MVDKDREYGELLNEADTAKHRLIEIAYKMEELGKRRKAKSLWTLVEKLEKWQHD